MSDFDGGAAAPADSAPVSPSTGSVPIQENAPRTPELGSQTPVAEKPPAPVEPKPETKPEPSKSNREALEKAFNEAKAKKDADKPVAAPKDPAPPKEPQKAENVRQPDGRFAPREGTQQAPEAQQQAPQAPTQQPAQSSPHRDAPSRFDDAAKTEWANAPESVKGAIHRTIRELEQGHQKYKADAEEFESVRQFAEMAKRGGGSLRTALETYAGLEHMIDQNPIGALEKIAQMKGFSLRQVAERVLGKEPDQEAGARDQEMIGLKQTIARLEQQVGGVAQTFQQQAQEKTLASVQEFASKKPRFDELADDIGFFLTSGRATDLSEAYQLAERLNPAPSSSRPLIPADIPAPAQTRTESQPNPAGQKSISGSPSVGSDPTRAMPPSSNNREALRKAFARQGL